MARPTSDYALRANPTYKSYLQALPRRLTSDDDAKD
jgi:hypothetical protein